VTGTAFACIFSLYPKEWLVNEVTNDVMLEHDLAGLKSIEPWWKLLLGNKALLPLLWSMFPNHPSVVPAYYSDPQRELWNEGVINSVSKDDSWVSKPLFGREGAGIFVSSNFTRYSDFVTTTENNYGFKNGQLN
jgi:glutathionylspermidine synthase